MAIHTQVPLAPLCTLGLGGPAQFFVRAHSEEQARAGLRFAAERDLPVRVLGGGSNLVIADAGVSGLVLQCDLRGVRVEDAGTNALVHAGAGEPWDDLVERCVGLGLCGLECLSGIPGSAGATPIQNVGAYGQEVAQVLHRVWALDRRDAALPLRELTPADCAFGYRHSRFKDRPEDLLVVAVTFALRRGAPDAPRYPELQRALPAAPSAAVVRSVVLELRRRKSMVLAPHGDADDENRRSVGSFFMNPVLAEEDARRLIDRAVREGLAGSPAEVPCYGAGPGRSKLAAGWLIEKAGVRKGTRRGPVGISSRHALALVHHGGGRTADLIDLARAVQDAVAQRFAVTLRPEPVFWGFDAPPL